MNGIDFTGIAVLAWMTLCVNPTLGWLSLWFKEWKAYRRSGRFGDGRGGGFDWANKRDPANGEVSLIKITRYIPPSNGPGTGMVIFYSLNFRGEEEPHRWRLNKWEDNIENIWPLSPEQATRVEDAGDDWPQELPTNDHQEIAVRLVTEVVEQLKNSATSFNSVGARISGLNTTLKRQEKRER